MPLEAGFPCYTYRSLFEDCPSHELALERLNQVLAEEGIDAEVEVVKMETDAQVEQLHFVGSPTILVEGRDIDPPPADLQFALTCRRIVERMAVFRRCLA